MILSGPSSGQVCMTIMIECPTWPVVLHRCSYGYGSSLLVNNRSWNTSRAVLKLMPCLIVFSRSFSGSHVQSNLVCSSSWCGGRVVGYSAVGGPAAHAVGVVVRIACCHVLHLLFFHAFILSLADDGLPEVVGVHQSVHLVGTRRDGRGYLDRLSMSGVGGFLLSSPSTMYPIPASLIWSASCCSSSVACLSSSDVWKIPGMSNLHQRTVLSSFRSPFSVTLASPTQIF